MRASPFIKPLEAQALAWESLLLNLQVRALGLWALRRMQTTPAPPCLPSEGRGVVWTSWTKGRQ